MRRSTAAGINNSLLPRDCSCGEFAGGAVWEETFFLAFVAFGSFGTGEGLLWYAMHFQGHSV